MGKRKLTFKEMPATFEYKGHVYHKTEWSGGWRDRETGNETFRYFYGPDDDRMFLWVDCYLKPEEDLFDYDQFEKSEGWFEKLAKESSLYQTVAAGS